MRKILLQLALASLLGVIFVLSGQHSVAHAATDGRLIDDPVFDNAGLMSAGDIQNFLNSFPSSCLKNYSDVMPSSDPTQAYFSYSGSATAAQIIRRVADDYGVNPRVILTKLQQEQSLVTGAAGCAGWRYTGAMGFNCPDGQSCPVNADNAGFSKQVTRGMWLLKISKERANGNLNWMVPDDASWVYGGPMTQGYRRRCGTCDLIYYDGYWNGIYLQSGATASLYNYTPHVPSSFPTIYEAWWGSTYAGSWNAESLDGSSNSVNSNAALVGGQPQSVSFNSILHVFYYDATKKALRWAHADNAGWHFDLLDGPGGLGGSSNDVGSTVYPVVFNNTLHVFYYDATAHDLKHAYSSDGATWQFEILDGEGGANGRNSNNVGQHPSAAVLGTTLHIFYYDATAHSLRHGWFDTSWHFENFDGGSSPVFSNSANVGLYSTATTYNSTLQVFYYDVTNGNLRHAWSDGSWHAENLDGDIGSIAHGDADLGHTPVAMVFNSSLQLFYYDVSNGNLRHGWVDGTGWHFENLDGDAGSIGHFTSDLGWAPTVTTYSGGLQLFYYDRANMRLRHAWTGPNGWLFENLDGWPPSVGGWLGDVGFYSTTTTFNGGLQLFYTDATNADLRHAWPR